MNDPRWIRTNKGYAGRNGFLIKSEEGFECYEYGNPEKLYTLTLARDAKAILDKSEK
jgi:hypothetical protein